MSKKLPVYAEGDKTITYPCIEMNKNYFWLWGDKVKDKSLVSTVARDKDFDDKKIISTLQILAVNLEII